MENYKCAATIVRNDGYDNSISVRHVFVRKDVEELNAIWSNENKLSFKIQGNKNQSFIGSIYKIKEDKQSAFSKWINALSDYTTVGKHDTIYTNIPIVFKNDKGEIDTVIEPYFMYGDVDDNGVYNVTDIAIIAAHINGIKTLEGDALKAADINHDGKVDYDDLPALSGHIKGIKPISQDATTTTTSATTTTKTFSTTTSITEYLEHSWTPEERFENFDIDEYKALLEEDVKSYPRRIDESIEQAYVEVMMAQVNNSSYCDQVPDKEWEEFCQLFNERVKAVYYNNPDNFTKEIHYFRNKLNRAPKTLLDLLKENAEYYRMYGEDKWQIMSAFGSSYHMFDTPACNNKGEYNLKFVSKNGLFEAVYNNDYQLLDETNDPINMGTYNYGDPNELNDAFDINSILNNNHFRLDMLTYTNEDYIQMAELINSILLIQSDKTGLKIGVTVISEILKAEKVQSKGWLNTPDSNYFNCSEFKSNYLKHTTNPLAVGHRETFESMLNNHEYYDITSDGKVHIISVG